MNQISDEELKNSIIEYQQAEIEKLKMFVQHVAEADIEYHTFTNYYQEDEDAEHIDINFKYEAQDLLKENYPEDYI